MKYFRFFICGLAVLVTVETGVVIYLNYNYLADRSTFTVNHIKTNASSAKSTVSVPLPGDAQQIACSHDGRYVSYLLDGTIDIVDMTTGSKLSVPQAAGMNVSAFTWVYDRDRLILAETSGGSSSSSSGLSKKSSSQSDDNNDDGYYLKTYYFDMKDKSLIEIRNNDSKHDIKIDLSSKSDQVTGIDLSVDTVVTYLKVTDKSGKSRIWEINVMVGDDKSQISTVTKTIGKIQCVKADDVLLYESESTGKIYRSGSSTSLSVNGGTSLKLLGFDGDDNVYVGKVSDGKVTAVYDGPYTGSDWQKVAELDTSADASAIHVTYSGSVYLSDTHAKTITELKTGRQVSYTGKLIGMCDGGYLTSSDGSMKMKAF